MADYTPFLRSIIDNQMEAVGTLADALEEAGDERGGILRKALLKYAKVVSEIVAAADRRWLPWGRVYVTHPGPVSNYETPKQLLESMNVWLYMQVEEQFFSELKSIKAVEEDKKSAPLLANLASNLKYLRGKS